jgi:hypothetical protein
MAVCLSVCQSARGRSVLLPSACLPASFPPPFSDPRRAAAVAVQVAGADGAAAAESDPDADADPSDDPGPAPGPPAPATVAAGEPAAASTAGGGASEPKEAGDGEEAAGWVEAARSALRRLEGRRVDRALVDAACRMLAGRDGDDGGGGGGEARREGLIAPADFGVRSGEWVGGDIYIYIYIYIYMYICIYPRRAGTIAPRERARESRATRSAVLTARLAAKAPVPI